MFDFRDSVHCLTTEASLPSRPMITPSLNKSSDREQEQFKLKYVITFTKFHEKIVGDNSFTQSFIFELTFNVIKWRGKLRFLTCLISI
jgi:hypothetical protein